MKPALRAFALGLAVLFAMNVGAVAAVQVVVPRGTDVVLAFDQGLSSSTARVGQLVRLHVIDNVYLGNHRIIAAGTPVTGIVSQVSHRKPFGVNAKLRIAFNPVRTVTGRLIPIEARSQGKYVAGKKSGQAAGATVGGAAVLGPVGLVGGYFIHGKRVVIHAGDEIVTMVSRNMSLRFR